MDLRNVLKYRTFLYLLWLWVPVLLLTGACSSLSSTPSVLLSKEGSWVLLPMSNLSQTATADRQAQSLIETELRTRGVQSLHIHTPAQAVSLRALLDDTAAMDKALSWARNSGFHYGLTGTINEWSYKSSADQEPAVGMTLKIVDLQSGQVLWQGNGARTGWLHKSLPVVANELIRDLLDDVRLNSTPL